MKLSQRITHLTEGGNDGWDVFYRARQMISDGYAVTELTIGEHDIRTDASTLEAMDLSARQGHTGYAVVPGTDLLRDTVAARLQARTGVPTTRHNVLITPGGQSTLFSAHVAVCDPGDVGLYLDPYYATYPGTIRGGRSCGPINPDYCRRRVPAARRADGGRRRWRDFVAGQYAEQPHRLVYSRQTLEGIAEVCRRRDLWLISDEVYGTQVWEGEHISPRTLPGMVERTLVVGSMSKSHTMTESRCGWIVGPETVISHLINLATHTTYGGSGFIQDAASFALNAGNDLEEQVAEPFRRRRALAVGILAVQNTIGLVSAQGAMYLMLDIRATGFSGDGFANALLDTHAIAVMPGESFGSAAAGHIRVAMTIDDDRFATALSTICTFASDLAAHHPAVG
ncbi:pyridoxal phosphate-dependent aminotransferase [Ruegeria sp. MALMAid1280]|uniref:pyridoxal phosphate-dependent aminotransferase n=1 Tax=Ruegeria sp. MALMAid1280 TaxID=3411634 RepID=UPI003B9FF7C0